MFLYFFIFFVFMIMLMLYYVLWIFLVVCSDIGLNEILVLKFIDEKFI